MVEVKAQVVGGPVLLAGDIIQVNITVNAPALDPALPAQSRYIMFYINKYYLSIIVEVNFSLSNISL